MAVQKLHGCYQHHVIVKTDRCLPEERHKLEVEEFLKKANQRKCIVFQVGKTVVIDGFFQTGISFTEKPNRFIEVSEWDWEKFDHSPPYRGVDCIEMLIVG